MVDLPHAEIGCHRTGFSRKCRELVAAGECCRWVQVQGMDPQTGEKFSRSDCVDNWGPMLAIEQGRKLNEIGAAVESLRNETTKAHAQAAQEIAKSVQSAVILSRLALAVAAPDGASRLSLDKGGQ